MGSGGDACATIGTGELTPGPVEFPFAPTAGFANDTGKPQSAFGGGSGAGGTVEVSAGATGVTGQLATFDGRPWQLIPTSTIRKVARVAKVRASVRRHFDCSMPEPQI